MTTLAHISDLHLLEDGWQRRDGSGRARLALLSFGRTLDARARRERAVNVLLDARRTGFDHLLITGDLTEDGTDEQFEVLAQVLAEAHVAPEHTTLVPGNHDAYTDGSAWMRALEGPLRPYAATSNDGRMIPLGGANVVPLWTAMHQSPLRSAGRIDPATLEALSKLVGDPATRHVPLVLAQHHQAKRAVPVAQWIDGLQSSGELGAILTRRSDVYVLHGHTHRVADAALAGERTPRVFSCRAVVETGDGARFYQASSRGLVPLATGHGSPFGRALPVDVAMA
jgi:3',5'-cyclic AMP phosphodiesterase CpdA